MNRKTYGESRVFCPHCDSVVVKAGTRIINLRGDKKQQYQCVECRRRTINPRRS